MEQILFVALILILVACGSATLSRPVTPIHTPIVTSVHAPGPAGGEDNSSPNAAAGK